MIRTIAMYHVMSRGNRREHIFLDDVDRHDFLKTLAEACQKTAWQVHAYCLMGNHYPQYGVPGGPRSAGHSVPHGSPHAFLTPSSRLVIAPKHRYRRAPHGFTTFLGDKVRTTPAGLIR